MPKDVSPILTKEVLTDLYLKQNKTCKEIASILSVAYFSVLKYLKIHNIKAKTFGDRVRITFNDQHIKDLYINKMKSAVEIGKLYNCGYYAVLNRLKYLGVDTSCLVQRALQLKFPKELLYKLFIKERIPMKKLSLKLKLNNTTLRHLLNEYNLSSLEINLKNKETKSIINKIAILYKKGYGYIQITKKLQVSMYLVQLALKHYSIKPRKRPTRAEMYNVPVKDLIKTFACSRKSYSKLAQIFNCSRRYIRDLLNANGFAPSRYHTDYNQDRGSKGITWRKNIFKRDNYKCIICGESGKGLAAHHIKAWSRFPKNRYKLNNGVTLCKKHHHISIPNSFHSIYGALTFTEQNFEEYLKLHGKSLNELGIL